MGERRRAEKVLLIVDEGADLVEEYLDEKSMELVKRVENAKEFVNRQKIIYVPMSEALRKLVLYEKRGRGKGNQAKEKVSLGDLGPFVIVRVKEGQILNQWGYDDLPKPMSVSPNILLGLKGMFVAPSKK
jgi:hypothetical protein